MAAFKRNLPPIEQGASYDDEFTWKTGATKETAVAVDLTGCTAHMQVRETLDSPTPLLDLTTASGGIILGGTTGVVQIKLTAAQTTALDFTTAVYDLEITFPSGIVRRLSEGRVSFKREVTR